MSDGFPKLKNPPVIEAILDVDCDLPPTTKLGDLADRAGQAFADTYPVAKERLWWEHELKAQGKELPNTAFRSGLQGYMFSQEDEKQLVQVRQQGYSFNRLTPYTSLDDYLPEIQRTWSIFCQVTRPIVVTAMRLRYINRFFLPVVEGQLELDKYLKVGPRLPDEERLAFDGFLSQYAAIERSTGHRVKTVLTTQKREEDRLPVILDIVASDELQAEPEDWHGLQERLDALRELKNVVFFKTLEEECRLLFQ